MTNKNSQYYKHYTLSKRVLKLKRFYSKYYSQISVSNILVCVCVCKILVITKIFYIFVTEIVTICTCHDSETKILHDER